MGAPRVTPQEIVQMKGVPQTDNNEPQTSESGSQQETENNQSAESNSEPKIVEITSENWTDYFEIVVEEGLLADPDAPEEPKKPDRRYNIVLKDGVVLSKETIDNVGFEFSYDEEKRFYEIDKEGNLIWGDTEFIESKTESKTITVGTFDPDKPEFVMDESTFPHLLIGWLAGSSGPDGESWKGYIIAPNNLEITNVSGKLPLE